MWTLGMPPPSSRRHPGIERATKLFKKTGYIEPNARDPGRAIHIDGVLFMTAAGSQIIICDNPAYYNLQLTDYFWDDAERLGEVRSYLKGLICTCFVSISF